MFISYNKLIKINKIMKRLILILFLAFSLNANSQIKTDKVAHFGVGFISGAAATSITLNNSNGRHEWIKSISVGLLTGFVLGVGKEFYDLKDYGVFNWGDAMYTTVGGGVGGVSLKFSINRYERKHLL
jgi:uncharacterized protein YfiM (DUF2279 family)